MKNNEVDVYTNYFLPSLIKNVLCFWLCVLSTNIENPTLQSHCVPYELSGVQIARFLHANMDHYFYELTHYTLLLSFVETTSNSRINYRDNGGVYPTRTRMFCLLVVRPDDAPQP